jgi:tRNA-specific 2-thiouridylase
MNVKGKNIFVGLSGGVDSAVTASLLKHAGANVVGVFIKGWYPEGLPCTWAEDRRDAMRVAAHLRIPYVTLDAGKEYKASVLEYLVREYEAGRTPNPDIMCNRDVKFGVFFDFAINKGADAIATGHYARVKDGRLFRGVDQSKDQSYFLWAVKKEALEKTLFPLGGFKKTEVRAMAKRYKLPVADKKDSQGICFLGPVSVEDFLRSEISVEEGAAFDEEGHELGTHAGSLLYTLGERVPLMDAPSGPWFVKEKRLIDNVLIVSKDKTLRVRSDGISYREANWFRKPEENRIEAQYRYHGPRILGTLSDHDSSFIPIAPLSETPAEGQSLVFYDGDECLGGGIISSGVVL